jgi:phosphate/phosphite/phosphonate ABC transporter binding protein
VTDQILGRYHLVRSLGRGGMGEVHLARAVGAAGFEKLVAVKVLDPRFHDDVELTRALLREALLGVQLDHPALVSVLDLGEDNRRWYIAMEYVRGWTLAQIAGHARRRGKMLPIASAVQIGRTVADALVYVHAIQHGGRGLLHGDISPSNLLLGVDGRIKVTDFGVASLAGEAAIAGKLAYLPPEAFARAPREQGWDVYALGVILWELLAGRPRVPDDALAAHQVTTPPPSLLSLRPEAPPALLDVVERAASLDPSRRFATARELAAALAPVFPAAEIGHREAIAALASDASFVEVHGSLPHSGDLSPMRNVDLLVGDTRRMGTQTLSPRGDRVLRLAFSPAMGAGTAREASERLAGSLTAALGREVRPLVVADYRGLVDALVGGDVDLAWMPPVAFVSALERGAGGLVALRRAGRATYESAIIVRDDATIGALEELGEASLAWVEPTSAAGYLFGLALLCRALGHPPRGTQHFHGSHRGVCNAVLRGWASAGATYASRAADGAMVSSAWQEHLGDEAAAIRALAFSPPIPGDTIAFRPELPSALAEELVTGIERWAASTAGAAILAEVCRADGVERVDLAAYAFVRAAVRA